MSTKPGWVRLSPSLLFLRLGYFNVVMLLAAFGGLVAGEIIGGPLVGLGWAGSVAVLGTLVFPRVAEEWTVAWRHRSRTRRSGDNPPLT